MYDSEDLRTDISIQLGKRLFHACIAVPTNLPMDWQQFTLRKRMNRKKLVYELQGDMLIDCDYENIDTSYAPNVLKVEEYGYLEILIRVRKDDVDFYGIIDCRNRTIADLSAREDENGQYISSGGEIYVLKYCGKIRGWILENY